MSGTYASWLLLLAMLYTLYRWGLSRLKCWYCGQIRGHDDSCPYQGVD